MGGGDHGELAARDVASDGLDGNVPVAKNDTGKGFHLDIGHRGALGLGEAADLRLGETDVVHIAGRDLLHGSFDFRGAEAEVFRFVAVEFRREFADGGVAARLDVGKGCFDGGTGAGVILGAFGLGFGTFQVFNGHITSLSAFARTSPASVAVPCAGKRSRPSCRST